jgi:DNA polymerase-3 subunit alpha
MLETIPTAMKQAEQQLKNAAVGMGDLFGDMFAQEQEPGQGTDLLPVAEMSQKLRLKGEKDTLGLYITGHPIDIYEDELKKLVESPLHKLRPERWKKIWGAGLVVDLRVKVTKSGAKMAIATIDDKTARLDVTMRPNIYEAVQEELAIDKVIMVHGEVREDTFNGGIKFEAEQIVSLAEARIEKGQALELSVNAEVMNDKRMQELHYLVAEYQNEVGLPLQIKYQNDTAQTVLRSQLSFYPDDDLIEALNAQGWQPRVVS